MPSSFTLYFSLIECCFCFHRIACISCPTMYHRIRELKEESCCALLFEFDQRFERFKPDFVFYDYNKPTGSYWSTHKSFMFGLYPSSKFMFIVFSCRRRIEVVVWCSRRRSAFSQWRLPHKNCSNNSTFGQKQSYFMYR